MSVGKLKSMSITRPITRSGQPPDVAADQPQHRARPAKAMPMLDSATPSAIRLP